MFTRSFASIAPYARPIAAALFTLFCLFVAFSSVPQTAPPLALAEDATNATQRIRAGLTARAATQTTTVRPTATAHSLATPEATPMLSPAQKAVRNPISQQDRAQYVSDDEYSDSKDSACSMAAAAMVLAGYGKTARITDLAYWMRTHGAPTTDGLTMKTFPVFATALPTAFGMRGFARTDGNLDKHFAYIADYIRKGTPVMADVYDTTWFPGGHWVVLTEIVPKADLRRRSDLPRVDQAGGVDFSDGLWDDGAVVVLNPDPGRRNRLPVTQIWPVSRFRQFFNRVHLSVVYLPS